MIKRNFIRCICIAFILFFASASNIVYAKDEAKNAKDYETAEGICTGDKLRSLNPTKYQENCEKAGCSYDSINLSCHATKCSYGMCDDNGYKYCAKNKLSKECTNKMTCEEYGGSCVDFDDYDNDCKKQFNYCNKGTIQENVDVNNKQGICSILFRNWDKQISSVFSTDDIGELQNMTCNGLKGQQYEICAYRSYGAATCKQVYQALCKTYNDSSETGCVGEHKFSYPIPINNGQGTIFQCACETGYNEVGGKCVKSGGGGGTSKCPENFNYVANGYKFDDDTNTYSVEPGCTNNSCVKADCDLSANPFDRDVKKYYNPKLKIFNGEIGIQLYEKAYMYTGKCNGKDTDVYCIDPSAAYHDNGAGYVCNAALNEEGETDEGFIKIYQLAIDKYKDDMSIIASPLSNGTTEKMKNEYAGIHMALRYWTFYGGLGVYSDSNEYIANAFSGTSQDIMNREIPVIRQYKNWKFRTLYNGSYFVAKGALNETQGYKDAVEFFTKAASDKNIWKNPLEFELISRSADKKTATIRLSNIQELKDTRYTNWNFVKNITCTDNCTIISGIDSNIDYLRDGYDYVDFTVSINNIGQSFTVMTNYYDRRDAKNIIIATSSKSKSDYQRLLFIASEPRDFKYDKTFNPNDNTCFIGGGVYYGKDGKALGSGVDARDRYLAQCCNSTTSSYRSQFCSFSYNKNINICKDINEWNNWINNGCPAACNPTNTTDKCAPTDYGTKDIIISDLTDKNGSLYTNDGSTDKYCYACAYSGDLTGKTDAFLVPDDNPYCAIYCVKDYKFTVPTNLGVNGDLKYGRYLSIGIGATGTQTCFTGEINTRKFKEDYKNAIDAADAAIKEYAKWKNVDVDKLNCTDEKLTCSKDDNWSCDDGGGDYYNCGFDSTNKWCNCMSRSTGNPVLQVKATQTQTGCSKNYTAYHITVNGVNFGSGNQSCDTSNCNTSDGTCDNVKKKVQDTIDEKYQNMINAAKNVNDIIAKYNSCSTFNQNFDFNPKIEFSYEESQYMSLLGDQNYLVGNPQTTDSSTEYYDSIGECSFINKNGKTTDSCVTHNNTRYVLNNETGLYEKKYDQDINCNVYVKTTETKYAALTPVASWCTKIGSGAAVLSGGGNSCGLNYRNIGNVYPLGRNCGKDKNDYRYGLKISNLGNVETVLSTVSGTGINNNLQYACDYHVNNKSCEGCESLYYYRSVSLNDLFTKVKEFHDMSNGDKTITNKVNGQDKKGGNRIIYDYTWSSSKGQDTKKAIEELGEGAYTKDHLQYSYELTPAGMKVIREYNDKVETIEAGGYGDFNLKCNGYNCISDFLNDIENKKYQGVISLKRYTDFTPYNGKPWK